MQASASVSLSTETPQLATAAAIALIIIIASFMASDLPKKNALAQLLGLLIDRWNL
jgi:hypothetical protein